MPDLIVSTGAEHDRERFRAYICEDPYTNVPSVLLSNSGSGSIEVTIRASAESLVALGKAIEHHIANNAVDDFPRCIQAVDHEAHEAAEQLLAQVEAGEAYHCSDCGAGTTAAIADDNHGYCEECAAKNE